MISAQAEQIVVLYRDWVSRQTPDMTEVDARALFSEWATLTSEPDDVRYEEIELETCGAMWILPDERDDGKVLLCSHGGGYIGGSMQVHRKFFGHVAKAAGCRALNVDYRLAPEFPHPASVHDMTAAYRWLITDQGYAPDHIALVGDSAGGALALTNIANMRKRGLPFPAATMPLSPWACRDTSSPSYQTNIDNDVLTRRELSSWIADLVLGPDGDWRDPLINPFYVDYAGFPPIYLQVGGYEAILDDSTRIADCARNANVDVKIDVFPQMQHCFQLMAGNAPEADDAVARLAQWVRPLLGIG
ncbi:MAG: alpha/beta hydrolase [Caenibius sp.]